MKKMILASLVLTATISFASTNSMTSKEKNLACLAIVDYLDYDSGFSVNLCKSGSWIVSDIEEGSGHRQIYFSWKGKVSKLQAENDKCSGYVYSYSNKNFKVIDLDCK